MDFQKDFKLNKIITKDGVIAAIAIVLLYAFLWIIGVGCPIKYVTGVSCLGCGMTRAWFHLLKLDFAGAFYYHPLVLLPIPGGIVFLFRNYIPKKALKFLIIIGIVAFVVVYIIRMFDNTDSIVVFEPQSGLISRIIHFVTDLL